MRTLVLILLLALGLAGVVVRAGRTDDGAVALVPAQGDFWRVRTRAGQPGRARVPADALRLFPGDTLLVDDDGSALRRLAFRLRPGGGQSSFVDLRLFEQAGSSYRLLLTPGERVTAQLSLLTADGSPQPLASSGGESTRADPAAPFELVVAVEGPRITVRLDGEPLLSAEDERLREGPCVLWSDGIDLLGLAREGASVARDDLAFLAGTGAAFPAGALLAALGCVAGAALWLAALVAGRAPLRLRCDATLVLLSGPALVFAADLVHPLPTTALAAGAALLAVPGLRLALHLLRDHLAPLPDARAGRGARAAVPARRALVVTGLAGWAALSLGGAAADAQLPAMERARTALPGLSTEAWSAPGTMRLDAAGALVAPGPWRSLLLRARVTLPEDAVLELRLRGHDHVAEGTALFLSTHAGFPTGFYLESDLAFVRTGSVSAVPQAGRSHDLELRAEGTRLLARLDGEPLAACRDTTSTAGPVYVLASAGSADVADLAIEPLRPEPEPPGPVALGWRAALWPVLLLGALAAVALRWTARGPGAALETMAFALAPLALASGFVAPTGHLAFADFGWIAGASAAVALLGLLAPGAAPGAAPRGRLAPALLAVALPPLALALALGPPERPDRVLGPAPWDIGQPRLAPGLVHLQHPLVRRYNTWLKAHRFRDQRFALEKPEGVVRVLCLGSSSTWGHGIPEDAGQDYPTVLGELLRQRMPHRSIEVINGAVRGATTARQLRFWREVLVRFDPDIVTLSFYFNDSTQLSNFDEAPWFERVTTPGTHDDPLSVFEAWRASEADTAALGRTFGGFAAGRGTSLAVWMRHAPPGRPPPERFAANLRAIAEDCRGRGVDVVFVKEPLKDDVRNLWKAEFHGVMDALGAEFGAPVVDPAPALQAAGGAALFMDMVHPLPEGHRVVAEVLRPVVERLLVARTARGAAR